MFDGLRYDNIPVLDGDGMKLIAVCRPATTANRIGILRRSASIIPLDTAEAPRALKGDIITVFTTRKAFRAFTAAL